MEGKRVETWKNGGIPGDNKVHSISPGEVLYSKYKYATGTVAKVASKKINVSLGQNISTLNGLVLTKMDNGSAYCGDCRLSVFGAGGDSIIYACLFDDDNDSVFESVMWGGSKAALNDKTKYIKVEEALVDAGGFKREIIFQGRTEKTIKFKYREFMNDMARPAFSQDIEYLINPDGTSSGQFKGLKIDVVSVDGNYIKYRVTGDIDQ